MDIAVEHKKPWIVLTLAGDLDIEAAPGVYLTFQRELLHGRTNFLVDLEKVSFVDTSGLGVLVRCYKEAMGRGGEVGLRRVPESIERILEFTRLDEIFRTTREDLPPGDGPLHEAA
jgi:anti-anti-sigma factor